MHNISDYIIFIQREDYGVHSINKGKVLSIIVSGNDYYYRIEDKNTFEEVDVDVSSVFADTDVDYKIAVDRAKYLNKIEETTEIIESK